MHHRLVLGTIDRDTLELRIAGSDKVLFIRKRQQRVQYGRRQMLAGEIGVNAASFRRESRKLF